MDRPDYNIQILRPNKEYGSVNEIKRRYEDLFTFFEELPRDADGSNNENSKKTSIQ